MWTGRLTSVGYLTKSTTVKEPGPEYMSSGSVKGDIWEVEGEKTSEGEK